jgi:hypothetical protein
MSDRVVTGRTEQRRGEGVRRRKRKEKNELDSAEIT